MARHDLSGGRNEHVGQVLVRSHRHQLEERVASLILRARVGARSRRQSTADSGQVIKHSRRAIVVSISSVVGKSLVRALLVVDGLFGQGGGHERLDQVVQAKENKHGRHRTTHADENGASRLVGARNKRIIFY